VIAVIGGGVAGLSVALALAGRGRRDVVVFDAGRPATSTERALGGFRTQHGSRLNIELALASRDFFVSRADRIRFQPNGYLYLAEDEAVAAELVRRAELQSSLGLPIEHPDPAEKVPFLVADGYAGTNFCALDGLYLPPLVRQAYLDEGVAAGVQVRAGSVATAAELDRAEAVVVAAGAWSAEVGGELGVALNVVAEERGVFRAGPFEWLGDRVPMTLEAGSGYHFRERDGELWILGPGDQHDWGHFRAWLERRVPAAAVAEPSGHWTGNYEVSFDHHALVGETERPGVWACTGFSGHGVMQSPAVGECLAAMMLGLTPPLDIAALSPLRTEALLDVTQL